MAKRLFLSALATIVVSGCGDYNFTPIPECGKGQVLTGDGKALKCVEASGGPVASTGDGGPAAHQDMSMASALTVPACGAGKCLTGDNAGMLQCVDVSMTNMNINDLINRVTSLENRIAVLEKNGGGGAKGGLYVGVSTMKTVGLIAHPNTDVGIASAAAFCVDDYGQGAHMCTVGEIYNSVLAATKLVQGTATPQGWVYAPAWNTTTGNPLLPLSGMGDNCAGYTYPTADKGWTGVSFEWNKNAQTGTYVPFWHGGAEATCHDMKPIACCK